MQAISKDKDIFVEATKFLRDNGLLLDKDFEKALDVVGWYAAKAHLIVSISGGEVSGVCLARQVNRKDFVKKDFTNDPSGDTMWVSQMATKEKSSLITFVSQMVVRLIDGKIKSIPKYIGWERNASGNDKFYETNRLTKILRNK